MSKSEWVPFDSDGRVLEPIRTPGVYECDVTEGSMPGTPTARITLHHNGEWGWQTTDGEPYLNPVARFVRCRRIGDLPEG